MNIIDLQIKWSRDKEEAKSHSRGWYLQQRIAGFKFYLLLCFFFQLMYKNKLQTKKEPRHTMRRSLRPALSTNQVVTPVAMTYI